jgi:hypothetical protein
VSVAKNPVGVWAFGSAATEPMVDKRKRVAEGLSDLLRTASSTTTPER